MKNIPNNFNFAINPTIGTGTHHIVFGNDVTFKTDKAGQTYMTVTVTKTDSPATRTLVCYPDPLRIWLYQIMDQLGNHAQAWATPVDMINYLHTEHIPLIMHISTVNKELTDANGNTTVKTYTNIDFKKEEN